MLRFSIKGKYVRCNFIQYEHSHSLCSLLSTATYLKTLSGKSHSRRRHHNHQLSAMRADSSPRRSPSPGSRHTSGCCGVRREASYSEIMIRTVRRKPERYQH